MTIPLAPVSRYACGNAQSAVSRYTCGNLQTAVIRFTCGNLQSIVQRYTALCAGPWHLDMQFIRLDDPTVTLDGRFTWDGVTDLSVWT